MWRHCVDPRRHSRWSQTPSVSMVISPPHRVRIHTDGPEQECSGCLAVIKLCCKIFGAGESARLERPTVPFARGAVDSSATSLLFVAITFAVAREALARGQTPMRLPERTIVTKRESSVSKLKVARSHVVHQLSSSRLVKRSQDGAHVRYTPLCLHRVDSS